MNKFWRQEGASGDRPLMGHRLRLMGLAACAGELYRLVRRPHTHGALVAIWWREQQG